MAFTMTQLMIAFMISTFITIIIQITLQIYIRSIDSCCWKCKKRPSSINESDRNNISLRIQTTNKQPLTEWTNENIISWIETTDISDEIKSAFIEEIKSNSCNGSDLASLKNTREFMRSFPSISNNTEICDQLFAELRHLHATDDNDSTSSSFKLGCVTKVFMAICTVWSYLLALIVMVHFFHQLHLYFKFVRNTVGFDPTEAETLAECEADGLGRIACPHLFEVFEKYEKDGADDSINEPYTLQQAENVCFWIYNSLVIANPSLFEYAWFATFAMIDFMLYHIIMFLTGCCVMISCDFWTMFVCWCGCCCKTCDCVCCPIPRCCCQVAWGNTCCQEGCCCYTYYGCFGFIAWLFQWVLAFVMVALVLAIVEIPIVVIASALSAITFVIVLLVTLPLCLCNPKSFCPLVFETFIGNDNAVDLKINEVNWDNRRMNTSGDVSYLCMQFWGRVFVPIPLPYDSVRNNTEYCKEKILIDPIELRAYGHTGVFTGGLFMILMIASVQTLISTFVIYFVIDGDAFIPWHWFEPFFNGVKDALVLFVEIIPRTVQDLEELKYVTMESLSLDVLIDFNPKQQEKFKYAMLLHRTVLHTLIGIIYAFMNR
eukprot:271336_1